ncbi:MAG: hypothetical protein H6574_21890 [Lewinellaceae bacterium]|nr:hypothetical protein [Saprospiraceae bacterium]MCB9333716.1 hypothetical protein [Lewinellaceae bacterium]
MACVTLQHPKYRLLLVVLFLGSASWTFAQQYDPPNSDEEFQRQYKERITKDRLHGIYIPKNLNDALDQLDKLTSAESKSLFLSIPEDSVCLVMHNRLGQWMIVNWSFYEGSRLSNYLRSAGITYPDDMADFLTLAFHRHLHKKPVEIRELATAFREKRKAAWKEDMKEGELLKEEVRKRPRPDSLQPASAPTKSSEKMAPKGGG